MEPQKKTPVKDVFLRTVAVLGLIAILLLGAWGIIQLAFALPDAFSSAGSGISSLFNHPGAPSTSTSSKESLTVSTASSLSSGQTLLVSWKHNNADQNSQYSYAVSYACQPNLTIKAPLPTGAYQTVPCNTPFNYVNASDHMNVVPVLSGSISMPLTITVITTKLSTGQITATGSASTNIAFATGSQTSTAKPTATTASKPSTTYYPAATKPATLYGYGDLAVTITSVAPAVTGTTVTFTIANVGTNMINAGWTFNASLPINGSYQFASQPQQALNPGDKIAYTLSFNPGTNGYTNGYPYTTTPNYGYTTGYGYSTSGYTCNGYSCSNNNYVTNYPGQYQYPYSNSYSTGVVTITADPLNLIPELNKNNNFAQTTVALY